MRSGRDLGPSEGTLPRPWPARSLAWLLGTACLGVLGGTLLILATKRGVGITPDGVIYIGTATSLARGDGPVTPFGDIGAPLRIWGIGYPLLLSAAPRLGLTILQWARVLAVALISLNTCLISFIVRRLAGGTVGPLIAAALFVFSAHMWVFASVLSDNVFYLLALGALYHTMLYIRDGLRWRLVVAGVAMGAGLFVRYAGAGWLAGLVLIVAILSAGRLRERIAHAAFLGVLGILPLSAWTLINGGSGRHLAFHPPRFWNLRDMLDSMSQWLVPPVVGRPIRVTFLLLLLAGTAAAMVTVTMRRRRGKALEVSPLTRWWAIDASRALLILWGAYVAFVIAIHAAVDEYIQFDDRIMLPAELAILTLGISSVRLLLSSDRVLGRRASRPVSIAAVGVLVAFAVTSTMTIVDVSEHGFPNPWQYDRRWEDSSLVQAVGRVRPDIPVFSNAADTVYLYGGRPCWWLPRVDGLADPPDQTLQRMREAAAKGHLVLAYSTSMQWRRYAELPLSEVLAAVRPRARVRVSDGYLYATDPADLTGVAATARSRG